MAELNRVFSVSFALAVASIALSAQSAAPVIPLGMPVIRNFTPRELRGAGQTWAVIQDKRGLMYFSGPRVILEYDGINWRTIPVPSAAIRSMARDASGRIWVGARATVGYLEPDATGTLHYVSLNDRIPPEHREFPDVWQTVVAPSGVYFRSYPKLFRWDGKRMQVWTTNGRFGTVAAMGDRVITSQTTVGLQEIVGDTLRTLPGGESLTGFRMQVIPWDGSRMLIAIRNDRLWLYDGQKTTPFPTEADDFLKANELYNLELLPGGEICVTTIRGGAVILDRQGRLRRTLNTDAGLSGNNTLSAFADREGALWLGLGSGMARIETDPAVSLYSRGISSDIAWHGGSLILAVSAGGALYRLERNPRTGLYSRVQLKGSPTQAFELLTFRDPSGGTPDQLLAATGTGVAVVRGDTVSPISATPQNAFSLVPSRRDPSRIFAGYGDGLGSLRWEKGKWVDEGRLPGVTDKVSGMAELPDGVLWAGTDSNGILRVEVPKTGMRDARVTRLGEKEGLPAGGGSVVWAAGALFVIPTPSNKMFRLDPQSGRFVEDNRFLLKLKGTGESEASLTPLPNGDIWSDNSTPQERRQGLFRRNPDGTWRLWDEPFHRWAWAFLTSPRLLADGALWFPSDEGVLRLDVLKQAASPVGFVTLVRKVTTGSGRRLFGGISPPAGFPAVRLPWGDNSLQFEFAAPTFGNAGETVFRYRMEGADSAWSDWAPRNEATYSSLPPGDYQFRVQARTIGGRTGEDGVFAFTVLAPWYRTRPAYAIYALLLATVAWYARKRVIQHEQWKARRQTDALEAVVAERTAEIAEQRDSITLLSEIGKEITASLELETILFKLYECVNRIADASIFGVGLYRPEAQLIEYSLAIENGKRYEPYTRDARNKNQLAVWSIDHRKPILIGDVETEFSRYIATWQRPVERLEDGTEAKPPVSMIYLPLVAQDRVLGVLSIQSFRKNAYTPQHLTLLENLAAYTTIALDNSDAYRKLNEREAQIRERASELATVNRVTEAVSTQLDTASLIHLVGDQVRDLFRAEIAYVALLDRASMMIHFPYYHGDDSEPVPYGSGLTSRIIRTGEPLLINEDIDRRREEMGVQRMGRQAASYLGVPIASGGEVVGVISVQSTREEGRFTEADQRLLSTIASPVGVAFHNARLFEEARQARAAAEQADEAKSTFLSTVSHELRTPLTSVLGFARIIRRRLEELLFPLIPEDDRKVARAKKQVMENLGVVVSEGDRLTKLINDVLDLAKIDAGQLTWNMETVSVEDVIDRSLAATSSLFETKKLEIQRNVETDLPQIHGDRDRLIQVVINLISNAVKFTDSGAVACSASVRDGEIVVSVQDSGIGIKPEDQPKVFEKFRQVGDTLTDKPQGTGLGLPISKEIVEYHGGRMWVESEFGRGSTFFFALPVKPLLPEPVTRTPRTMDIDSLVRQLKANLDGHTPRPNSVLVVDDDPNIRSVLQQEFTEAGYVVRQAENGRQALQMVRDEAPGLIILDVMMPEMNGFDVAAVLKNDPATMDIPIIILSIVEDKERGFRLGVDRYLTKPIDTESLFREVGMLLEQGKSTKRVMVVDEDDSTVRTLTEVLRARGYHVTESNGAEMVSRAVSLKPDVIILNSLLSGKQDVVQSLRFEKGLENVLFLIYQ